MASGLAGKSVIVTGAARGVGRAIAHAFVKAGAAVMMADIDEARLETEVETLTEAGLDGRATAFVCDLREKLAMANLMAATMDAHEGIDILVNAGRMLAASDPLDPEGDRLEETLAQNVTANLRLSQIVARRMIEMANAGEGRPDDRAILNVTSVFAQRARPDLLAYSVASAALDQLTRALALALAPSGIRVNALAVGGLPGRALTEALPGIEDLPEALGTSVPLGRAGDPRDYAAAALFLASPAARFITGQVLAVDGGRLLVDPLDSRGT
jgi:7-alpha-hydroxysteroid dehydrogenase